MNKVRLQLIGKTIHAVKDGGGVVKVLRLTGDQGNANSNSKILPTYLTGNKIPKD